MRIILNNSKELESKELDSNFFDNDKFFILIKNKDVTWPISYSNTQFIIKFETDEFNSDIAKQIHAFVDNINPKKTLYINCSSGIEQAAAIRICH